MRIKKKKERKEGAERRQIERLGTEKRMRWGTEKEETDKTREGEDKRGMRKKKEER